MSLLGMDVISGHYDRDVKDVSDDFDEADILTFNKSDTLDYDELFADTANIQRQIAEINGYKNRQIQQTVLDGAKRVVRSNSKKSDSNKELDEKERIRKQQQTAQKIKSNGGSLTPQVTIPKSLMDDCRRKFSCRSNSDAVAALLYMHRDPAYLYDDVPDHIVELAMECDSFRQQEAIVSSLERILQGVQVLKNQNDYQLYMLVWLAADRIGFNIKTSSWKTVEQVDFYDPNLDVLIGNLVDSVARRKRSMNLDSGRPYS